MGSHARLKDPLFPSGADLELISRATAAVSPSDPELGMWFSNYAKAHRVRLANDLGQLRRYASPGASVVEFGSVPLILTVAMKLAGYNVTGLDIMPERFADSINGNGIVVNKCDVEGGDTQLPSDSFDIALFNEIFEHLRINPIITMKEVHRILKPGGILLLSTPNLTSMHGWMNLLFRGKAPGSIYDEYEKLQTLGHMGHVREYTGREVCDFLLKCGFSIKGLSYRSNYKPNKKWKAYLKYPFYSLFPGTQKYFSVVAVK